MTVSPQRFLLTFIFLFLAQTIDAQTLYTLKGTVTDSSDKPLEFGNILVLNPVDSSLIKGAYIWNGAFELTGIEEIDILIKITAQGYQDYVESKQLNASEDSLVNLGTIQLNSGDHELEVIEFVYIKPMFERQPGKLVVNVEETILSDKGTLRDLLKSLPNVIVKSDDQVIVVGKGAAIIYLDGQRILSLDMLSSISSNDVSRIEVIENPSAKYDAEGNAVIEIFTVSGSYDGYEGSLGLRGMKRTETQAAYWGRFRFKKDWFSMYAGAGQYTGRLHQDETYRREIDGSPAIILENTVDRTINHKFDTWAWLDTDYRLDSNSTLFLNYSFSREKNETVVKNSNAVFADSIYDGVLNSSTRNIPTKLMHSVSGGYVFKLDTAGSDLRITGQYTNFDFNSNGDISQISQFTGSTTSLFKSHSTNDIGVLMGQADLTKKFSKTAILEIGAKNSYVTNSSGIDLKYNNNGDWITDSSYFNEFDYNENILAGYAQFSGKVKKFAYVAGLRYEWTQTHGDSYVSGAGIINRNYQNLFPSLLLTYDFAPDLILGLSYNNRIQRPKYTDLDPFIEFIDSLTSFRGNPQLYPGISHNAEINLVYMEYASISFSYNKSFNPMFLSVVQNPSSNTFSAVVQNIKSSEMYSIGLVLPYELTWWTTFNSFGYSFNNYEIADDAIVVVNNKPSFYISLYNEFRIPKVCNIEITYDYTSPGAQGFFNVLPYQSFGGSISRDFFDKKFNARLSLFDLFLQNIERGTSDLTNFNVSYTSWFDTRSIMLTLIWNFGKLRDRSMTNVSIDSEEKQRLQD